MNNEMEKELFSEKIRNLADSMAIDALGFAEATEFTDYSTLAKQPKEGNYGYKKLFGWYHGGIFWNRTFMHRIEQKRFCTL
jgi:hypothetical protein